jgi:hypothetical protein
MEPFFRRLPGLSSRDKAAAVNLGIFPDSSQPNYARPSTQVASQAATPQPSGDRLASIEDLLGHYNAAPQAATPSVAPPPAPAVRLANVTPRQASPAAASSRGVATPNERYWVQLASGTNAAALPGEFDRIASRSPDYFEGLSGYAADGDGQMRLLIGPFKDQRDARDFADALEDENISAFSWVSPPGQPIRKIVTR